MTPLNAICRTRRGELGLSQTDVAAAAGIDRTALVRFESGERSLRSIDLDRLLAALALTLTPSGRPARKRPAAASR